MEPQTLNAATPAQTAPRRGWTRFIPHVARILMGLPLFVTGLNGLFHFFPEPNPPLPAPAMAFLTALMNSHYMMPLIMVTQVVVGGLLLSNRLVPLALVLFAPFMLNSVLFHLFLEPSGRVPSLVFAAFLVYLMWAYRAAYRPLFQLRHVPQ